MDAAGSDPYKPACFLEGSDVLGAAISHTRSQASDKLVDALKKIPLVRHAPDDAFRDQLFNIVTAARKVMSSLGEKPNIAIIMAILVGTDGEIKMSKSIGNPDPVLE